MENYQAENPYAEQGVLATDRGGAARETALGKRVLFWVGLFALSSFIGLALVRVRPILVFAGLFGGLAATLILRRPWYGLLIYTAVFMLRPGELSSALARLRLEMLVGCVTLAGLAFQQYFRDGRLSFDRTWQSRFLVLFIAAAVLSTPLSYWRSASVEGVMTLLKILAFYIMVIHLVDTRRQLKIFIWTLLILTIYVLGTSLQGTIHVRQGIERVYGITSSAGGPNSIGALVAATFPLVVLLAMHKPLRWVRPLLFASALMLIYLLVITGSRSGLLGFLAGLGCLWWMSRKRVLLGLIGGIALVASFAVLPDQYKQRYATMASAALDSSSQGRLEIWKDGFTMAADRPLLGVGINCFRAAHRIRDGWGLDAHSMYLQILAEVGLLGALPFFGFLIQMVVINRRTARMLVSHPDWDFERIVLQGVFAGLCALLVTATFGTQYIKRVWYIYGAVQLVILRCYLANELSSTAGREEHDGDPGDGSENSWREADSRPMF